MLCVRLLWTAGSLSPEKVHITFHWALGVFKVGESTRKQEAQVQLVVPSLTRRDPDPACRDLQMVSTVPILAPPFMTAQHPDSIQQFDLFLFCIGWNHMGHTPFSSSVAGFSHSTLFITHPCHYRCLSFFFAIFFVHTESIQCSAG